jgi:anaerobic magnesium-protoporphyrin IX monomethyl ester cyclase
MEKKTKIALVNSPVPKGVFHHPLFPPLGLAYLAAVLEQDGHEVMVIDCPSCALNHEDLKKKLSSFAPKLVGITAMTPIIQSALLSARAAKDVCPDSKVILGGPHATFMDKQILSEEPAVDIVVRGEGEQTLVEIARNSSRHLRDIDGITFKNNGLIVQTPDRPFIQNLDDLPRPAFKHFPLENYRIFGKMFLPIMTSRGCPFQCSFCVTSKLFGEKFRARTSKSVVDELEWLRDTCGANGVSFYDDTLTLDKKRMLEICNEIKKRKIRIPWGCQTRVDQVTKEIIGKMREANCDEISFGVESGCQKILDAVHKKTSIEQNEKAIRWAKEEGLFVAVSAIIAYPGETMDMVKQTVNLVRRMEPDDAYLCIATPYPGTELRALIENMGWKISDDWSLYDTMTPVVENPLISAEDLTKIRKEFYNDFYSPQYVLRQLVKGNLKGNFYSKIMTRIAMNHLLWRIKAVF